MMLWWIFQGIAKRLVSTVLDKAAAKKNVSYNDMIHTNLGCGDGRRRDFHDDISVIVVFLDKPTQGLQRLKKTFVNQFKASSSHAFGSQAQKPETLVGESSETRSLLGQTSWVKRPSKNLKKLTKKNVGESSQTRSLLGHGFRKLIKKKIE
jgi:hypothetical protein